MPFSAGKGSGWVNEMADLEIGQFKFTDGYVNDNMFNTLLSEGVLEKKDGWTFHSGGEQGRICITPAGHFMAERIGTHNFWPTIQEGQLVELDIEPHVNRPVDSVTACILMLNIINLLTAEYIAENQVRIKGVLKRLCQPGGVEE